jgi:uncharacterized phage protein (TIGR02218 family)
VKTISVGLLADFQAEVLTMNTCLSVVRTDGTGFYFTDCDAPIVFGGHTYLSVDGYSPSQMQTASDFSVDHVDVISYFVSGSVTEVDLMAGKWDDAAIRLFMVNRKNLANGAYEMRYGLLGNVSASSPGQFQAELRGLMQWLQKKIGRLITPTCHHTLGDINSAGVTVLGSHCTVNLPALAVTAVPVTSVTNNQAFHASSLAQPDTYFQAGWVTWTTGLNTGRSMDVQAFANAGGSVVLQLPMLNNVIVGDQFTIYPGCLKRFLQDCVQKYANGINHGGFKDLPGIDKMIRPGGI